MNMLNIFWLGFTLSACSLLSTTFAIESDPIVATTSGKLVGQSVVANGLNVYRFLGVPYAQAPVGKNRFEKPLENVNQSDNIITAQQFKPTCVQMKHLSKTISPLLDVDEIHNVSEDCLYLNIYVPATNTESPLPIMVWLPGEGFDFADARQFNGAYLASMGNVIVITVQYRVGVFGFLKDNAGLWDQLIALKWINQNARNFGGDPENVTLFGRFTGSMSISILLSSPQTIQSSVPLFNRAILMSGIAVGNWVFDKKHDDKVKQVFENTDCTSIECLKSLSEKDLLAKGSYEWKPFIDSTLIEEEPLIAVQKGKFPKYVTNIMLGSNQFEGSLCLLKHLVVDEGFYNKIIENNVTTYEYEKAIREDLQMFYGEDYKVESYKPNNGIVKDRAMYVQFCSELLIDSHMREYENLLHRLTSNNTYRLNNVLKYKLDYKPSFSIAPEFINSSIHGDDVILAFGLAFKNPSQITQNDKDISLLMVSLFSNFAQSGIPLKTTNLRYIEIRVDMENSFNWSLNNNQLSILVFATFMISLLILLINLLNKILKYNSSKHMKQLMQNYKEFY